MDSVHTAVDEDEGEVLRLAGALEGRRNIRSRRRSPPAQPP